MAVVGLVARYVIFARSVAFAVVVPELTKLVNPVPVTTTSTVVDVEFCTTAEVPVGAGVDAVGTTLMKWFTVSLERA